MDYKIIWSERVYNELLAIFTYLKENWSGRTASDFAIIFSEKVESLRHLPLIGSKSSQQNNLRKLLITKHSYLLYEVIENTVQLFSIIDTRQNTNTKD